MALKYEQFMPNKYEIAKDLSDRLDGTIVRYRGVPYSCKAKMPDGLVSNLELYRLGGSKSPSKIIPEHTIKPDDPDLDISMLESMYFNYPYTDNNTGITKNIVVWTSSSSSKTYKSGTYPQFIHASCIDGSSDLVIPGECVFWSDLATDCIMGKYPDLDKVLSSWSQIKREQAEVAVDQRVALRRESIGLIKLYVDAFMVGWIDPETGQTKITNDDRRWAVQRILEPIGFTL